jgi:hypothetical protein
MSCFQFLVATCDDMRKAIANQWWGMEEGKRKLHWRSWEWLSSPKEMGGLGFRDFEQFNQAMLGRQCWRLLTDQSSLCARVLKARYFPDCNFWEAPRPRSSSYTWRSILFGRELLKKGVRWGIGNGKATKIISDNWIPGVPSYTIRTLVPLQPDQTVDSLILAGSRAWDENLIRSIFSENVASKILQVPISRHGGDDFASWPHSRFGQYTVRSAYRLARSDHFATVRSQSGQGLSSASLDDDTKRWKTLWSSRAPGKMKITLWRFAHDCLPCGHQLQKRHVPASPTCVFCNQYETVEHALLFCQFAREVWQQVKTVFTVHLRRSCFTSPRTWTLDFLGRCSKVEATVVIVALWHI